MSTFRCVWTTAVPVFGIWFVSFLILGAATAAQGQPATEAGMQILTRGPVHEAFAEASMTGATAGVVVTKAPYDPISEIPPEQRPEGGNVAWIPGYWSYDDDRSDFIWVSGVWRDIPPGRQWVPGYWTPVTGGSQWISGFWGPVAQTEVTYLPPPPEPLEAGPSSPAPAPGNIWTSGSWVWQDTRYDWQPGYWVPQQPDWVWAPAHYTWTPRGYVYVPGYWDHDIGHRGVMFAPVYYDQPVYARPNYFYSPSIVIDLGVIAASLFIRTNTHHYYFGDYYDRRYEDRGFHPWYSREARHYGDDPMYMHYRSEQMRRDPDWDNHIQEQFSYRREHVDARPPQTLALQVNIFNTRKADTPEDMLIGRSFAEAAQSKTTPLHFAAVNADERKRFETRGQEVRKFQADRAKLETVSAPPEKSKEARAVRMQLPVSPVAAAPSEHAEGVKAPPPIPVAPKPQAVEGKSTQENPQKAETATGRPQPQDKPGKTEAQPAAVKQKPNRIGPRPKVTEPVTVPQTTEAKPSRGAEKPNRVAPKAEETKAEAALQATEPKPSVVREKPNRVEARPESIKPEATPQTAAPLEKPAKRESVRVKTETNIVAPQNVDKPKPERVNARPEAKPATRKVQKAPQTVEPIHESPRPQEPKPEVRTQSKEPNPQAPRAETQRQGGKRQQAPNTDSKDKDKKN